MSKDFNNQPLVSIIINCYNGEAFLRECIESVLYCQVFYKKSLNLCKLRSVQLFTSLGVTFSNAFRIVALCSNTPKFASTLRRSAQKCLFT